MVFSSTIFIFAFLPVTIVLYYILPRKFKLRNILLLIVSLVFYAWGEPRFVVIMLATLIIDFFLGRGIGRYRDIKPKVSKRLLVLSIIFNLGVLFIFKYLTFALTNINHLFNLPFEIPVIGLPIGISFYTFQAISYLVDVYRKKTPAQKSFIDLGLFISFFPQLIAGPIVRYTDIAEQIKERKETFSDFSAGILRFMQGVIKKVLIANTLALVADRVFDGNITTMSGSVGWVALLAFSFQIFFDFSGYSDMAIGLGRMFGFRIPENFNYPYIAKSASEYWRRWHMSLGRWFNDYVFMSISFSKALKRNPFTKKRLSVSTKGTIALFITWALTGTWHGANWTFICWGLYYFVLLFIEKRVTIFKNPTLAAVFGFIYAFLAIRIGQVFFRADTLADAVQYLSAMVGTNGVPFLNSDAWAYLKNYGIYFIFAAIFSTPIVPWIKNKMKSNSAKYVFISAEAVVVFAAFIISLASIVRGAYSPFIYFNF